jgi:ABC-type nitrate/sulfonate/bicarbonate transport system ATPase subunit
VQRGQVTALVAGNGQGKSTLLDLISGVLEPDSGRIWVAGQDMTTARSDRRGVFYVPQSVKRYFAMKHPDLYCYLPGVTVRENVLGNLLGDPYAEALAAEERLVRFGLTEVADALPAELSVGMQQRLALARALANRHDVLLLDEPLASVDRVTRMRLLSELTAESAGRAVVYVTHDPTEVEALGALPMQLRDGILHDPAGRPLLGAAGYAAPPPVFRPPPVHRVEELPSSGPRLAFGAATAAMGLPRQAPPAPRRRPEPVSFAQAAMPQAAPQASPPPAPAAPLPHRGAARLGAAQPQAPAGPPPGLTGPPPGVAPRAAPGQGGIPMGVPVASTPKPARATPGEGAISLGVSVPSAATPPLAFEPRSAVGASHGSPGRAFTDTAASWQTATHTPLDRPAPAPSVAAPTPRPALAPQAAPKAWSAPAPAPAPQPRFASRAQATAPVPTNGSGRPSTPEAIRHTSALPQPAPGKAFRSLLFGVAGSALRGVLSPRGGLPGLVQLLEDLASSLEEEAGRLRRR